MAEHDVTELAPLMERNQEEQMEACHPTPLTYPSCNRKDIKKLDSSAKINRGLVHSGIKKTEAGRIPASVSP